MLKKLTSSLFQIEIPKVVDVNLVLRALAVTAVIYWHIHGCYAAGFVEKMFTVSGRFAVWVFFGLSGYLIGLSLGSRYTFSFEGVLSFYRNRYLRILPIFFFVSVTILVFRYFFEVPPISFALFNPVRELLMLQWEHAYSLNGVFWTLGVEAQFYLLAPALVFLCKRDQALRSAIMVCVVIAVLLIVKELSDAGDVGKADARSLFGNLVHFFVGIGVAFLYPIIRKKVLRSERKHLLLIGGVACLVLLLANSLYFESISRHIPYFMGWRGILLASLFTVLMLILHIMLEAKKTVAPKYLSPLLGLGVLSYGVYAWHGAVNTFSVLCRESFVLNLVASITLAYLSYVIIEKPLRKYRAGKDYDRSRESGLKQAPAFMESLSK